MSHLEDITQAEWDEYEWIEVSTFGEFGHSYVRGKKKTPPPNDGYHYWRADTDSDKEYKWKRVQKWWDD